MRLMSCLFSQFINLTFLSAGKECLPEHFSMTDNSEISRMCSLCVTYFNISHIMYICLFYGEKVLNRNAVTTYVNKGILYTRPESNKNFVSVINLIKEQYAICQRIKGCKNY